MKLIVLGCGSSGLTLAHLPAMREAMRRFSGVPGARLMHGVGDARKTDALAALGADKLWEVAASLEWPWFRVEDVERHPAERKRLGNGAGMARNEVMRDALLDFQRRGCTVRWLAAHTDPGLGKGTRGMVRLCREQGWRGRILLLSVDGHLLSEEAVS